MIVGTAESSKWFGSMVDGAKANLVDKFVSQHIVRMRTDIGKEDLLLIAKLMSEGKVVPVIDRTYKLSEVPQAVAYVETGRARGKVVITVD